MDNLLVILLFVFVIAGVVYAVVRTLPGRKHGVLRVTSTHTAGGEMPYKMVGSLLTGPERNFYSSLAQAVGGEMHIFSKVRLADLIEVKDGVAGKMGYFRRISQKHVDFVLCAPDSMKPMLVIELDDDSHNQPEAQARDQVKNAALGAAGLPILRIPTQQTYQIGALAEAIRVQLRVNATGMLAEPQEITRPAVGSGFVAVVKRMRMPARKQKADKPARKDSPLRSGSLRKQLAVPLVVIVVVVVVFTQLKATSTNANPAENAAVDPLLTPQTTEMVDTPAALVLPTESAPAPTPVPVVAFSGDATVNVKGLNMRSGPGTQFESLGSFAAGTRLSLLGKDSSGAWANVKSAEGVVGWMSVKYVTLSVPIENVPLVPGN